jgi:hypothetical protein
MNAAGIEAKIAKDAKNYYLSQFVKVCVLEDKDDEDIFIFLNFPQDVLVFPRTNGETSAKMRRT